MDIFLWIRQVLEPSLCCIKAAVGRLAPETAGTTVDVASQIADTVDYADPTLLSISVVVVSGQVLLNGIELPAGTYEFTAENGALLVGPFSVFVDGAAIITRTFRS